LHERQQIKLLMTNLFFQYKLYFLINVFLYCFNENIFLQEAF
jgi:hypothetical protein